MAKATDKRNVVSFKDCIVSGVNNQIRHISIIMK